MKRLVIIFLMVLPLLLGQTIIKDNHVSIAWDPVISADNDIISYEIFITQSGDYVAAQSIGQTELLEFDVEIPNEGNWIIGVRTVRTIIENNEVLYSEINWSDQNGEATPNPFIVRWYMVPAAPNNLRTK